MKERLLQLLDHEQLTPSRFADLIGVQRSSVSHVLSGRNKPSFDFLQKTLKTFHGLNAQWLIMGSGSMYGEEIMENEPVIEPDKPDPSTPGRMGTLFPVDNDTGEGARSAGSDPGRKSIPQESQEPVPGMIRAGREGAEGAERPDTGDEIPERKVVRVLLFYDDHTFSSYSPSH